MSKRLLLLILGTAAPCMSYALPTNCKALAAQAGIELYRLNSGNHTVTPLVTLHSKSRSDSGTVYDFDLKFSDVKFGETAYRIETIDHQGSDQSCMVIGFRLPYAG